MELEFYGHSFERSPLIMGYIYGLFEAAVNSRSHCFYDVVVMHYTTTYTNTE